MKGEVMRSEFESRETFECIFGGEDGIDLSKDETGEYSFQPTRFAYSFFLVAWQHRQTEVDELQCEVKRINLWYSNVKLQLENKEIDSAIDAKKIDELQKRVDAVKQLIQEYRDPLTEDKTFQHALSIVAYELEQALKGGEA